MLCFEKENAAVNGKNNSSFSSMTNKSHGRHTSLLFHAIKLLRIELPSYENTLLNEKMYVRKLILT